MQYDSQAFKELMNTLIVEGGYPSIRKFCELNELDRSPLQRAMSGRTRPGPESIDRWSRALSLPTEKRLALYRSVGHLTSEQRTIYIKQGYIAV